MRYLDKPDFVTLADALAWPQSAGLTQVEAQADLHATIRDKRIRTRAWQFKPSSPSSAAQKNEPKLCIAMPHWGHEFDFMMLELEDINWATSSVQGRKGSWDPGTSWKLHPPIDLLELHSEDLDKLWGTPIACAAENGNSLTTNGSKSPRKKVGRPSKYSYARIAGALEMIRVEMGLESMTSPKMVPKIEKRVRKQLAQSDADGRLPKRTRMQDIIKIWLRERQRLPDDT